MKNLAVTNERYLAARAAILLSAISVIAYANLPNAWSATHLVWDYHFGFIRRALTGSIVGLFVKPPISYGFVCSFSYAVYAIELAMLLGLFFKTQDKAGPVRWLLVFYFISFAFTDYAQLIGYLDHILIILVMLLAFLPARGVGSAALFALLAAAGMCVHEVFFVLCLPVLITRLILGYTQKGSAEYLPVGMATFVLVALYYFLFQKAGATMDAAKVDTIRQYMLAKADFRTEPATFGILERNAQGNLSMMKTYASYSMPAIISLIKNAAYKFAPYMAALGLTTAYIYSKYVAGGRGFVFAAMLCVLPAMPIAAALMGFDFTRWFCHATTLGALMLMMVIRACPAPVSLPRAAVYGPVLLLAAMRLWRYWI